MNIAITGDLHFHPFPDFNKIILDGGLPISSRLYDQLMTFRKMCVKCKDKGVGTLIISGDLFHKRDSIPVEVHQFVYATVRWVVKDLGIKVILLSGNHDQADYGGAIHSLFAFQDIATLVCEATRLSVQNIMVNFVPYMTNQQDVVQALADLPPAELLVAHIGVDGAEVGPVEFHIKSPVTQADLKCKQYKWVVLSHYHKYQLLNNNTMYIGSPWQIDRAERGNIKRFLVYDPAKEKMLAIKTGAKEYRTLTSSELIVADSLEDHYYDVFLDTITARSEVDEALERLKLNHYKLFTPTRPRIAKARTDITTAMSDEQLLTSFITHKNQEGVCVSTGLQLLSRAGKASRTRNQLILERVVIENFLTIGKADVMLHRPGSVVAILGINHSNGFKSNGAGKSSLFPESIFWCLFGETAREVPVDKVVNRFRKRDCRVTVYMQIDGHKVSVTRHRKHKKLGGDGVKISLDGVSVTLGTPRLTEDRLKQILGLDFTTFNSVVAFSPDTLRFVSSTDANQKHVLDSILQTRRFTAALEHAKTVVKNLRKQEQALSVKRGQVETLKEETQNRLTEYDTLNKDFETREKKRVFDLNLEVEITNTEIKHLETLLGGSKERVESAKSEYDIALSEIPDLDEIMNSVQENSSDLGSIQGQLRTLRQQIATANSSLENANALVGKPCPKCGQAIANLGKVIAGAQSERNRLTQSERGLVVTEAQLTEQSRVLNQQLQDHKKLKIKAEMLREACSTAQKSVTTFEIQLKQQKSQLSKLLQDIKNVPHNDFSRLITECETALVKTNHDLADLDQAVHDTTLELKDNMFWVDAFGNSGIRSFLLDQILPDLTEYANKFSERLTGGSITIEFKTYTEGAARDMFQIIAINQDGSDMYCGDSSGEKRRVDVCVMLSLFRIANSLTRINVLLLDETLDSLDSAGLDNTVPVLTSLAEELGLTIFVTSHTDISAMFHESIIVEKKDGISVIRA